MLCVAARRAQTAAIGIVRCIRVQILHRKRDTSITSIGAPSHVIFIVTFNGMPNVAVTRVVDSFDDVKIELSTICDVTLREKLKEPTLQLHAKFEAPALTANEVRMSELAEIGLYCRHHDVTAEKWRHIPKPPFPVSGGNENLTSDDPSGVGHDDVISSTDSSRITSMALKMAPKQPVPAPMLVIEYLSGSIIRHAVTAGKPSHTITQDLGSSLLLKGQHETRKTVEVHVKHDHIAARMLGAQAVTSDTHKIHQLMTQRAAQGEGIHDVRQ